MAAVIEVASSGLILVGCFFLLVGSIGLLRMPDLYTRMHAASVIDTAGAGFLVLGLMLHEAPSLVSWKLCILLVLSFFTAPVVSHALAQAALHAGLEPVLHEDRRLRGEAGDTEKA